MDNSQRIQHIKQMIAATQRALSHHKSNGRKVNAVYETQVLKELQERLAEAEEEGPSAPNAPGPGST